MPIRMRKDEHQSEGAPQRKRGNNAGGGASGGGGLLRFIVPLILKNPKLIIIGLILFGGWYLFKNGCNSSAIAPQTDNNEASLYKGCEMKAEEYDKAYVFAALADKEKLPTSASLAKYCPTPKNQGQQGSCVGWGSAYAARTIMESLATGIDPDKVSFSPSFLYNQIKLPDCHGAYINKAMEVQKNKGAIPFENFAYNENSCEQMPSSEMIRSAKDFNIHGYNRLTSSEKPQGVDMLAIKQNIANGGPVVIGMLVGGSFMQEMMGKDVWNPSDFDFKKRGFGGHCMCLIGYDDNKYGGAFQIYNSWGPEWGNKGIAWVRYEDFLHFTVEAYGVDPLTSKKSASAQNMMVCEVSLIHIKPNIKGSSRYGSDISLSATGEQYFSQVISKNQSFKIQLTNTNPCYTYVLGEETDKSTYVLFPYTAKHSSFCGITGTRVFPQDFNMYPDDIGSTDLMAVIISKNPFNINDVKTKMNRTNGTFYNKIKSSLGARFANNPSLKNNKIIFDYNASNADAAFCVIAINKK